MGIFSEIFDSACELGNIFKEFGEDMHEILTDGVKEIVIDKNPNYKTSSEKRHEASEIINNSDEKLQLKRNEVKNKINKANEIQKAVLESRCNILGDVKILVEIKQKSYDASYKKVDIGKTFNIKSLNIHFTNFAYDSFDLFPSTISLINSKKQRVEEADAYLSSAKTYRTKINMLCAEIDKELVKLEAIMNAMIQEQAIHKTIRNAAKSNINFNYSEAVNMLKSLNLFDVTAPTYINDIETIKRRIQS